MQTWAPKTERCAFLVDNLDLEVATGYDGAKWEQFQLAHLQDDNVFRIEVKSRQIAWSWTSAAEAVADGILNGIGSVFVSINLDEAKEKIRYALNVIEGLPKPMRPKLLTNNRTEIEFDNGARLISLPATAPRGKASMNVYLDEFAHVRDDVVIYTAALPMISKGERRLRVASSPMGGSGRFWEIATESLRKYPGYGRKITPWWEVQAFSQNAAEAYRLAPAMTTAERVERYGSERIKAIFDNMPEGDAQQEYECAFVDEAAAWITWDEIKANQDMHSGPCVLATARNSDIDQVMAAVDELAALANLNQTEFSFAGGYDVGRTRNTSELFLVGLSALKSYPLRLALTLDNCDFDSQLEVISYALTRLPVLALLIDHNGIGRNLAENAEKAFPGKAAGVDFTNTSKALWATNGKMLFQQKRVPLPADRDIAYQIHSIKKTVTPSKNAVYDTARNEKHHADKFWSLMLALDAGQYVIADPEPEGVIVQDDEEAVTISPY
jgi:phage FluMu gp28-like protein